MDAAVYSVLNAWHANSHGWNLSVKNAAAKIFGVKGLSY